MRDSLGFHRDATHDHAGRALPPYVDLVGGRYTNAPLPRFEDATEIRRCHVRSWLDPEYSRVLAMRYGRRLTERFDGKRGLFLTLTYKRDCYADPRDLYRCQSEQRHLREFVRRLAKYLGEGLTGKWCAKMEFQRGGWLHWHVVVETSKRVAPGDWPRLWPHGFGKAQRLNRVRCRYFCKYFAKNDESLPAFLYFERPRSVTIIRSSPGFWGDSPAPDDDDPGEAVDASLRELAQPDDDPSESSGSPGLPGLPAARHACPCFVPLGQRLTDAANRITVITRRGNAHRRSFATIRACIYSVICAARHAGCVVRRRGRRYFVFGDIPVSAYESGAAAKRPAALDLIEGQKPRMRSADVARRDYRSTTWVQLALTQLGILQWG